MWTSYSARHAAQLIGLPESAVRSCIRDGLVGAPGAVPAQLSFRDLSALRTVKALVDAGLPLARVRRELSAIQRALPAGASLAELTVEAHGGRVHVRGAGPPSTGQPATDLLGVVIGQARLDEGRHLEAVQIEQCAGPREVPG